MLKARHATKRELQAYLAKAIRRKRPKAFLLQCFEKELPVINAAVKKHDPNHLNSACASRARRRRCRGMTRGFDVFSLNIYRRRAGSAP